MMNRMLIDYLRTRKALVDEALEARLPREDVEPKHVHAAMRYAALSNGKRLRPILSLAVGELGGCPVERVLGSACALELMHTASLILDDLPCMDNARSRRDLPCTHVSFGEATALLAVMGLVALSFDLVSADADASVRSASSEPVIRILAEAMGTRGLVLGQHIDLAQTGCACDSMDLLEEVHRYKAGALFLACVLIPAHLAGMGADQVKALETYARSIGFAFQITDDLLDARRGSEDLGKSTFVTLLGREAAERKARVLVQDAIEAIRLFGDKAEPLRALATHVTARKE